VRGEAYTEFLRDACALLQQHGVTRRVTLHPDGFRSDRCLRRRLAYAGLIDFEWQQWIDEGLFDAASIRSWVTPVAALSEDPLCVEMIDRCVARGMPVLNQRYMYPGVKDALQYHEIYEWTRNDARFAGFCLYEVESFLRLDASQQWQYRTDQAGRWIDAIEQSHRGHEVARLV
jgi:hypothetical protein